MQWRWPTTGSIRFRRPAAAAALLAAVAGSNLMSAAVDSRARAAEPLSFWQPVAVFGTDDRVALPGNYKPLGERIGVLFNIRLRTVCSAFCVAPGVIGTAAHCLFNTRGERPPKLADLWFARNYDQVRDYARIAGYETGAAAQNVIAGSFSLSTTPPIDAAQDWAFVRLSRPICSKGVFEILSTSVEQIIREANAGRVFQVSYHRDFKQWRPAYSKPCQVERNFAGVSWSTIAADFKSAENLVLHTCDTGGASSGSPLLLDAPSGPKVIGINVGTYVQSRVLSQFGKISEPVVSDTIANTGMTAAAFSAALEEFKSARILGAVAPIRELQERLQRAHFYSGPIDGTYGPALKQAIDAYQSAAKLPQTGIASEELLQRLRQTTGPISAQRPK